jgi:ADP-ribose pyrophosphatase YjhB (NUDIX family)/putative intracellular protease/amidase
VILYPGCLSFDVALAAQLLGRRYQVLNVSEDGSNLAESLGLPLQVHTSFSQVDLSDCKAILIPGREPDLSLVPAWADSLALKQLLQKAHRQNIYIAAVGNGVLHLIYAGLLTGSEKAERALTIRDSLLTAGEEGAIELAVELGIRLDVVDARFASRTKDYYRGLLGQKIRALALGLIQNDKGQFLLQKMIDRQKNTVFYRPLGGGVEFHETAREALTRELKEELGFEVKAGKVLKIFENIFSIEGLRGHEMVTLFQAQFVDEAVLQKNSFDLFESGKIISQAVWRSLSEVKDESSIVYPVGIEEWLI